MQTRKQRKDSEILIAMSHRANGLKKAIFSYALISMNCTVRCFGKVHWRNHNSALTVQAIRYRRFSIAETKDSIENIWIQRGPRIE